MSLEGALAIFGSVTSLGAMAGLFFAGREVGKAEVLRAWSEASKAAAEHARRPSSVEASEPVKKWLDN